MATVTLTTSSSTVAQTPEAVVHVRNTGGRDAELTCRGVTYVCATTDRDGGLAIPAKGAIITGRTGAGTTTLDVTAVEALHVVDGGTF